MFMFVHCFQIICEARAKNLWTDYIDDFGIRIKPSWTFSFLSTVFLSRPAFICRYKFIEPSRNVLKDLRNAY